MREQIPTIRVRNDYGDLVARDGVVLCFFMRRSHGEVAPAVWNALQAYRRAILPQVLGWYGSDDGDTLPLDDKGWEHIRWRIIERASVNACIVELQENSSGGGDYHFDYHGRVLDSPLYYNHKEGVTSGMAFSFPTEYLLEHGPAHLWAVAIEISRELPFSFGYASLAFIAPRGTWFGMRRALLSTLKRYPGLDLYHVADTSRLIGTGARGAYWLTFLGQPLLGQVGGLEGLRPQLAFPEVTFEPMEGDRLLLTLGEWPEALDTEKGAVPPQYRALARLLEPYFCEEGGDWPPLNRAFMHRWLRRLCD
jgi:hypothetical protein